MKFQDYYKILGVSRSADDAAIKKAFRKAARKYHPDINPGVDAEAKFKDVNEAYEVLKDPDRRAAYDQLGREPPPGAESYRPPPDWDAGFSFSGGGPQEGAAFSDFFETLFRRSADPHGGMGRDSHTRIEIALEDAYRGAETTLNLRSPVVAPDGSVSLQDRAVVVHIPAGVK